MLMAEKRRRAVIAGKDASTVEPVNDAEQPVLLKEVYKRADITKPRNLLGLTKDIAPADMEALLLASITVNEDAMRELALQRGVAVKDYLASRKLPVERMRPAEGPATISGVAVETDDRTGLASMVAPLRIGGRPRVSEK